MNSQIESDKLNLVENGDVDEGRQLLNKLYSQHGINGGNGSAPSASHKTDYEAIDLRPLMAKNKSFDEVERINLTWDSIVVTAPAPKKKWFGKKQDPNWLQQPKKILRKVSGYVEPGTLLAVMGASGAGKTTLMNVLTYRNRGDLQVDGLILVNGQPIGKSITRLSAYVQQEDLFFGSLKVREHLTFQALLRMDRDINKDIRLARVEEVIQELGLGKCADNTIGDPHRGIKGISGGEMKRLSFASEILTNPALMFCDEPTSGLDSFMAQSVVSNLQNLASQGRTILCTIHQPSSEVYAMFDRILLMAEGRVAYLGSCSEAIKHFERLGYVCPTNFNPADYFIQILAIVPGKEKECKEKIEKICDEYDSSPHAALVKAKVSLSGEGLSGMEEHNNPQDTSPYKASWWEQFKAVLWRSYLCNVREPMVVKVRTMQTLIIALVLGLVFFQLQINQDAIQNVGGALFLVVVNMTFASQFAVIQVFTLEVPVFLREHFNGMYRSDVYFICKNLVELPYQFFFLPILFMTIVYWMVGLYPAFLNFAIACGITVLVANCAVSFGYLVSAFSSSLPVALAVSAPLTIPLLLFGGLFINPNDIPPYFVWINYISWFFYGYEALLVNQWDDIDSLACDVNSTIPCLKDGEEVLEALSFDPDSLAFNCYMMLVLILGYRLIAYVGLYLKARRTGQ